MSDFVMPFMGGDMDSGRLVEWKVSPGDRVERGQVIAAVETSKAVLDVEVFESGVVEALYVDEDEEVDVGTPLARIGDGSGIGGQTAPVAAPPAPAAQEQAASSAPPAPAAREQAASGAPPAPAGALQQPPPPAPPAGDRTAASPAARRRAREQGIDLAGLRGTGPDGAVVLRDLPAAGAAPSGRKPAAGPDREGMRRAIAATMSRSKREIPHYYLAHGLDLHASDLWLEAFNAECPPARRILPAALFMKATALALAKHGDLNGHYGESGFTPADSVHLGMAIHLRGGGLVAPAIRDADRLALPELMAALKDLVQRARHGGLRGSEMGSGTATVTALGERGVDAVWGVIHPPQVAMIGFGRPRRRPMALDDGSLAVRLGVEVTLAADHRVCDGHLGALFLDDIDRWLQQPEAL